MNPSENIPLVSEAEKARRQQSVDFARGSIRLEGIFFPPEIEEMNQRYINGEISSEQLTEMSLKFVGEM